MRATIFSEKGPMGQVWLDPDGAAQMDESIGLFLTSVFVPDPNDPSQELMVEDGDAYIAALPAALSANSRVWAQLENLGFDETAEEKSNLLPVNPQDYLRAAAYGVTDAPETEEIVLTEEHQGETVVAHIVGEYEDQHLGRTIREPERLEVELPREYDGLTASASEAAVRRAFLNGLASAGAMALTAGVYDESKHPRYAPGVREGGRFRPKAVGDLKPGDVVAHEGMKGFVEPSVNTVVSVEHREGEVMEDGSIEGETHVKFDDGATLTAIPEQEVLVQKTQLTPEEQASFDRIDALKGKISRSEYDESRKVIGSDYYTGKITEGEALSRLTKLEIAHFGSTVGDATPYIPTIAERNLVREKYGLDPLVAAAPVHPPKSWFEAEEPDYPMPLTITADGQVMGHAAIWGSCHTGFPGRCTQPPNSPSGYSYFHTGALELDDGSTIPVGRLTFDGPHASMTASRAQAAAHYDNSCKVGAYVTARDGKHGIWISGAVKPGLTDADLQALRASAPSGDWRRPSPGSPLELVGILGVNVAGFPVPRSLAASALLEDQEDDKSEVLALVAAGLEDTIQMADAYYERQLQVLGMLADGTLADSLLTDTERRMTMTAAAFDESKHPRHERGKEGGGEFRTNFEIGIDRVKAGENPTQVARDIGANHAQTIALAKASQGASPLHKMRSLMDERNDALQRNRLGEISDANANDLVNIIDKEIDSIASPEALAEAYVAQDENPTLSAEEQNAITAHLDKITDGHGQQYIDAARGKKPERHIRHRVDRGLRPEIL